MTSTVRVRLGRMADALPIAHMSRDLIEYGLPWSWRPERVRAHIRNPDSVVLVARLEHRLAGFAIMQFGDEDAHLDLLAVRPLYQRRQIGRLLVEWLEKSARVAGISTVFVEVRTRNRGARAFYRRLGYREIAFLPGYYDGRESGLRMLRDLSWIVRPSRQRS